MYTLNTVHSCHVWFALGNSVSALTDNLPRKETSEIAQQNCYLDNVSL